MAIVTRSLGVMPYQGGTILNSTVQTAMCRLSSTRMVWFYYQTNPNWLVGAVVDTPGGLAAGGTPVLTNQQLLTQRSVSNTIQAVKINATTVAVVTIASTGNFAYYVYEIDPQNGIMTQADSGTYRAPNPVVTTPAVANFTLNSKLVYHSDNLIQYFGQSMNVATSHIQGIKGAWNGVTKKLTWDINPSTILEYGQTGVTDVVIEMIAKKIPGRQMTLLSVRHGRPANAQGNNGSRNVVFDDTTGAIHMTSSQMPGNYTWSTSLGNSELLPLAGDRAVMMNGNNGSTFYTINYDEKTYTVAASGQFSADNGFVPGALLPLSADYFATIQRTKIVDPSANTALAVKVIRRYDNTFVEQSPASSMNSNAGFIISGTPATRAALSCYPEMIEGKIFWWGCDLTGNKLTWTLAGLNQTA